MCFFIHKSITILVLSFIIICACANVFYVLPLLQAYAYWFKMEAFLDLQDFINLAQVEEEMGAEPVVRPITLMSFRTPNLIVHFGSQISICNMLQDQLEYNSLHNNPLSVEQQVPRYNVICTFNKHSWCSGLDLTLNYFRL